MTPRAQVFSQQIDPENISTRTTSKPSLLMKEIERTTIEARTNIKTTGSNVKDDKSRAF